MSAAGSLPADAVMMRECPDGNCVKAMRPSGRSVIVSSSSVRGILASLATWAPFGKRRTISADRSLVYA